MWIGSHIHTSGGEDIVYLLKRYHANFGGKTVQIVGGSTRFREAAPVVRDYLQKTGMKLFVHSPFTWNLAKEVKYEVKSLIRDLEIADAMGAEGCVLHFGKSVQQVPHDAEALFFANLVKVLDGTAHLQRAKLFIETCAGQGTDLYATKDGSLDELVRFYSQFTPQQKERLKFCVDTCHIFAAGCDINTDESAEAFWMEWHHKLGYDSMGVIHMNNSAKPYKSRVDRHAALAHGHIGIEGLTTFAQHADMHDIPMIIETPPMEYDIAVLQAMIDAQPLPNIEGVRRDIMFNTVGKQTDS